MRLFWGGVTKNIDLLSGHFLHVSIALSRHFIPSSQFTLYSTNHILKGFCLIALQCYCFLVTQGLLYRHSDSLSYRAIDQR